MGSIPIRSTMFVLMPGRWIGDTSLSHSEGCRFDSYTGHHSCPVSSAVEHLAVNQVVGGSNPSRDATSSLEVIMSRWRLQAR